MQTLNEKRILGVGVRNDKQVAKLRGDYEIAKEKHKARKEVATHTNGWGKLGAAVKSGVNNKLASIHKDDANVMAMKLKDHKSFKDSKDRIKEIKNKYKDIKKKPSPKTGQDGDGIDDV